MPKIFRLVLILATLAASAAAARADGERLSPAGLKIYRAAFAALDKDRWAEARRLAAEGGNRLAEKVIRWLDLTRPGPGRSFAEIDAFLEANPDWPRRATLQARAEEAMPDDLPADEVLLWFGDRRPRTIAGTIHLGRALLARGVKELAVATVRRDWVRLDMNAEDERKFLSLFKQYLEPQDHAARLDRLLWDRQESAARRMLNRVGAGQRALAEARLKLMNMEPGVDAAIARVPPKLMRDPGLVYERALWRRRKGMADTVIELLDPPPKQVPRPDMLWNEEQSAARLALDRGDISVAYRLAKNHGAKEGLTFAEGEWLAGWIALRFLAEHKIAYEHFTRLYAGVSSGISRARAAYWAGRAAEEMGDIGLARNWYKSAAEHLTTFYGQLAAHRLGQDSAMRIAPPPEPTRQEQAAFAARELVRVVGLLGQLDETDRARPFLSRLSTLAKTPVEHVMIADLATRLGREDLAVEAAKDARWAGVELIRYLYPLHHVPEEVKPEHALILAIMRQESAFATDAVSPAGARGLMQIMPRTAKHVARRLDLRYSKAKLTGDPTFNIRLGSAYLDTLLQRFDGSYLLAVAAYNAGPSNVTEWLRVYGDPRDYGVDPVDWIEMIPFAETRNYVQRVLESLQVYRTRLGQPALAISLAEDLTGRAEY